MMLEMREMQGYEPGGSLLPGRNYSSSSYRFGFNGMPKDDEINGATGTSYDFGARLYDPRVGRWLSLDPLANKYPGYSPYVFGLNNPIFYLDIDGRDVGAGVTIVNNSSKPIIIRGDGKQVLKRADGTSIRIHGDNQNFDPKDLKRTGDTAGDDDIRTGFTLNTGDSFRSANYTVKQADGSEITYYVGLITRADGTHEVTQVHDPDFIDLDPGQDVIVDRVFYDENVSTQTDVEQDGGYKGSGPNKGEVRITLGGDAGDATLGKITITDDTKTGKQRVTGSSEVSFDMDNK